MDRSAADARQKLGFRNLALLVIGLLWSALGFAGAGDPPVIEFFTIDAGAGHQMIEKAVKSSLEKSQFGQTVLIPKESVLVNDHLTAFGNFKLSKSYVLMSKYAPWMWELTYSTVPKFTTPDMRRSVYRDLITPQLIQALTKDKPDLIYCTQPMLAEFIDVLKEDGYVDPKVKVVNMVTDYSVTEAYNTRGLIIVPHQSLKDQLVGMGKDPNMVKVVSGIPAREQFRVPYTTAEARKHLASQLATENGGKDILGEKDPFFVAFGGGEGLALDKVIDFLPHWHPDRPVKLAVVCGKNEALLAQLNKMIADGKIDPKVTVIPRGFIKNIDEYMKASDAIISKPGGSATAESITLKKPLFAHSYVPGQERKNFAQLTKLGVIQGLKLEDLNDVGKILERAKQMTVAIDKEFPDAKAIPDQINQLVQDYVSGKIPDSPSEQASLQRRIGRNHVKNKDKRLSVVKATDALTYPKREEPNTEMITLEDPQVDQAVRERLLSEARTSIDIGSFGLASDHVGLRAIKVLRQAQNQGVSVRAIYEKQGTKLEGDASDHTAELLADSNLSCPAGVVCGNTLRKLVNGLSIDDFFHMKLTIIDHGTPNAKIVGYGGRNNGKLADIFGDAAFVLRPVDPSKPWIGDDLVKMYDEKYQLLSTIYGEVKPKQPSKRAAAKLVTPLTSPLRTDAQKKQYEEISAYLNHPPVKDPSELPDFAFQPKSMQLVTNNVTAEILKKNPGYTVNQRSALPNDIIKSLHQEIQGADSAIVSSYAINLPDAVKADLLDMVRRGGSLTVVTNGHDALEGVTARGRLAQKVAATAADMTMENMIPFLEAAEQGGGKVEFAILNPVRSSAAKSGYKYLHRKLMLLKRGERSVVLTGSDNWTQSSATKNEEMVLAIEDGRMAAHLEKQVRDEIGQYYDVLTTEDVRKRLGKPKWFEGCFKFMVKQLF